MKRIVTYSLTYILFGLIIGLMISKRATKVPESPTVQKTVNVQRRVVLNAPTQHIDGYERIGHLHSGNRILPLYGRQTHRGSSLWQYYTMSDGNIPVRLHFSKDGRDCGSEYGCKEIYDDDTLLIQEYGDTFRASIRTPYLRYTDNIF